MVFAHDTEASLLAAIDLVNSGEDPDTLTTQEQVDAWYAKHKYTGRRDRNAAELAELRAIRPVLEARACAGADLTLAVSDVVRGDEMSRLSVCADQNCGGVVLDLTRNRSRRFCSTTCANRSAVAAYRARTRRG